MKIPLPKLMRQWREKEFEAGYTPRAYRNGLALWGFFARRPRLYRLAVDLGIPLLGALGRRNGRFRWLPFAGGWTRHRDMPAPEGRTFQQQWVNHKAGVNS